ncbi:MAG: tRNA (adenosine(37)-N6)-threonylcarbamoyltransferase complex dimerization subunit type 1 TsaB [Kiritimatiellae bacterium]|nr:tRNA (adenosine(37)-N6)-threonylcarbamoyltransferase complex dimerization subunit type 1 TsaB [Kiritimatiellia bacterium]
MSTLYIERSVSDGSRGDWVESLDLEGVDRIVVGTGPGSFAGIRSALAFAQGYALGRKCEVLGLPSACAFAGDGRLAVVGDARRGLFWVALFDGFRQERDIFQVGEAGLAEAVPGDFAVTTPDAARIDQLLKAVFGERYIGGRTPTEEGLRRFAEANPAVLRPEPLPIYLNPAVR